MSYCKSAAVALICSASPLAAADGYALGIGVDGDTADGRAISAFGDFAIRDDSRLFLSAGAAEIRGFLGDRRTRFVDADIDHWFEPLGVRVGGGYWGDPDILDSRDLTAAIYLRGQAGSLTLNYERRKFEFDLQSDQLRGRTATFDADGWGMQGRLNLAERVGVFAGGTAYDYSRDLRIEQDIDVLSFLTVSRLSMLRGLIEDEFSAGIEFEFGLRRIDFTAGRWTTAVDGSRIDSYSVGFLAPLTDRTDVEFRLAYDDSELFGQTTAFSIYLYYFGGS